MYWHNPGCDHFITIDLRTFPEVERCPAPSDMILDIPLPPLSPEDFADMAFQLYDVVADFDENQCIAVFCAKGKRSAVAAAILKQGGFQNVIDLGGVECNRSNPDEPRYCECGERLWSRYRKRCVVCVAKAKGVKKTRKKPIKGPPRNLSEEQRLKEREYNRAWKKKHQKQCACGATIAYDSERCPKCAAKHKERIKWPSPEKLKQLVAEFGLTGTGQILGVTKEAVRLRIKKYEYRDFVGDQDLGI